MLSQPQAWDYAGVSRSEWFRLKAGGLLPRPVFLAGSPRPRYRRADLDAFVASLGAASHN